VDNPVAKKLFFFRRFAPPNPGQRHFLLYEASLLSMRTFESPFGFLLLRLPCKHYLKLTGERALSMRE
jgi:hypothetical protein